MAEQIKTKVITSRQNKEKSIKEVEDLYSHLPEQLQKAVDLAKEKGASTWLTALPLTELAFPYISQPSMMRWPCDMAGHHPNSHHNVTVAATSQWNMHSHVQGEGFPQTETMKSGT